ncbi:MAG: hypothetical protein KDK36_16540 [Leptospiraceae bacterium]|nr:hypothetical protein [Leptospiraceae bacterium]
MLLLILSFYNCSLNLTGSKNEKSDYSSLLSYLIQQNNSSGGTTGGGNSSTTTGSYYLGVSVNGLNLYSTLILQNNFSEILQVYVNGTSKFSKTYKQGENYSVTVFSQPQSQTCNVVAGAGTFPSSDVYSIFVNCQ